MKILVIDRDRLSTQMMRTKLEDSGHDVVEEVVKNNAIEIIDEHKIDAVFMDPAPLTNARPLILGIRRSVTHYTYICLLSHNLSHHEALEMGANDMLSKPIGNEPLFLKADNANRMVNLVRRIGDESEDFPSAGGVIAKSAFNQLFLSAIDRADRYSERSFILFISLSNYEEIKNRDGSYAAEYAVSKMAQYLVRLRRQSDIIAQTGHNEYALLLQRPQLDSEPLDAAARFSSSLIDYNDIISGGATPIELTVELIDLPVCSQLFVKKIVHQPQKITTEN